MKPDRSVAPLLLALALSPLASAQESRGPDEPTCRNVNFPSSEERLVRACHAQFNFCANPPPAWQRLPQVMQVCAAIERERLLPRAAISGAPREPAIVNPPSVAIGPGGHAAALAGAWKLNGNGFVGDASVQQNADGTLIGSVYGDALTGYYAPGERVGVWLRLQGGRPIQAFVGQASADGASLAGRIYTLNATTSGGSAQRNLFAFAAQRGASAPPNPGLPPAAAGPANVSGTHAIVGNGFAGTLQLNQAPDGALSGSVYGQPIEGHYAAGSGTIAFIRYSASGQPYQLFVGSVTPQGVQNGEFFALSANAGASAQRMRFGWTLQAATTASAPAQSPPPQNRLGPSGGPHGQVIVSAGVAVPPAGSAPASASGAPPPATITGWEVVTGNSLSPPGGGEGSTTTYCPSGKVATGVAEGSNSSTESRFVSNAPLPDGSGWLTGVAMEPFPPHNLGMGRPKVICVDRPDGYRIASASRSLAARERAVVEAACPPGSVLVGGGTQAGREVFAASSAPRADGRAWQAYFRNDLVLPGAVSAQVFAICVSDRYAASLRVVSSGETTLPAGGLAENIRASCGSRSLSAGMFTDVTTVRYSFQWLQNPNPGWPARTWMGALRVFEGNATFGLRAICAQ